MRTRLTAALTAAALTAALASAVPTRAADPTRAQWWRTEAIAAANVFAPLDDPDLPDTQRPGAAAYADMMGGYATLYGWTSPYVAAMRAKLYALRNPDGGWGLNRPYDAFNGIPPTPSVNPASTTYTITLSGHVCPKLLDGFKAGVIPRADVQTCVNLLVAMPRTDTPRGQCVAYSGTPADVQGGCVHNVNAITAWFLAEASGAGFGATGMQRLITDIALAETVAYRETQLSWPYIDDGAFLDADHDSAEAEAIYRVGTYWVGREVAYRLMAVPAPVKGPIVHTRLTGLPGGPGSWSRTAAGVTLWCELGDQWRTEQHTYLTSGLSAGAAAQFMYYAARNSRACG